MRLLICVLVGGVTAWAADSFTADSARGAEVFRAEACMQCHSVNGTGGTLAPDLGRRTGRGYTPVQMASLMWNHAPAMWSAMRKQGVVKSSLSEESAADLFAYLYSVKYFDKLGDAGRGRRAFADNSCGTCHAESGSGVGPAVAQWSALTDPVLLVNAMWNHAAGMRKELEAKKIAWPQLTSQELVDMLVYLQNLPAVRGKVASLKLPATTDGEQLFQSKGCVKCHTGRLALDGRLQAATLTDVAVAMWNHAPVMERTPIELSAEEMRSIVSYVWGRQFFLNTGNPDRGKRVFTAKNCASCHNDPSTGAPSLAKTQEGDSAVSMIAVLWEHGPRMLDRMNERKVAWPRFTSAEMSDLIAYLRSTR